MTQLSTAPAPELPVEAAAAPAKLSALVVPEDYTPHDAEYWTLYDLTGAVDDAERTLSKEFEVEVKKVIDDGDIRDLYILTRAIRHWYEFNGEDRVQAGTLMASILYTAGVRELKPGKAKKTLLESAARHAKDRLNAAGIPFVDDIAELVK